MSKDDNSILRDLLPVLRADTDWTVGLQMSEELIHDIKTGQFDDDRTIIMEPWESKQLRKALKAVEHG